LAGGLDVDPAPERSSADDVVADPDDDAVHGRVHVRSGRRTDVEDRRGRAVAPELVPGETRFVASCEPADEPSEEPLVGLLADRLERQRAVVHGVVADRGDALLCDRDVDLE
jgi:hypothetical protein